jgi:hypothetical protein
MGAPGRHANSAPPQLASVQQTSVHTRLPVGIGTQEPLRHSSPVEQGSPRASVAPFGRTAAHASTAAAPLVTGTHASGAPSSSPQVAELQQGAAQRLAPSIGTQSRVVQSASEAHVASAGAPPAAASHAHRGADARRVVATRHEPPAATQLASEQQPSTQ